MRNERNYRSNYHLGQAHYHAKRASTLLLSKSHKPGQFGWLGLLKTLKTVGNFKKEKKLSSLKSEESGAASAMLMFQNVKMVARQ